MPAFDWLFNPFTSPVGNWPTFGATPGSQQEPYIPGFGAPGYSWPPTASDPFLPSDPGIDAGPGLFPPDDYVDDTGLITDPSGTGLVNPTLTHPADPTTQDPDQETVIPGQPGADQQSPVDAMARIDALLRDAGYFGPSSPRAGGSDMWAYDPNAHGPMFYTGSQIPVQAGGGSRASYGVAGGGGPPLMGGSRGGWGTGAIARFLGKPGFS